MSLFVLEQCLSPSLHPSFLLHLPYMYQLFWLGLRQYRTGLNLERLINTQVELTFLVSVINDFCRICIP